MDFRFSSEEEAFRTEVREFLSEELPPFWDRDLDTEELGMDAGEFGRQFQKKLAERNWLALPWPKQYGGLGATVMQQVIFNEEMAFNGAPTGFNMGVAWVGPMLMIYGAPEQKETFLPRITSLEHTWCTLYSEPGSGSDLASIQTRAVRDGDEWVINGQKIWTSGAHRSNWGWIACRTNPDAPKHKGLSMFIMPMDIPGITIRPLVNMGGQKGFNEVFLEDVRIPAGYLIGQENMGWYQLAVALDFERSSIAGSARARRLWLELVRVVKENGEATPQLRRRLAEAGVEIEIARFLSYRVATLQQAGKIPNYEATIAKLYSSEMGQRLARTGMDVLGLHGQLQPKSAHVRLKGLVERYYVLSVAETIAGGTSEIMRNVAAVRGLGLPKG